MGFNGNPVGIAFLFYQQIGNRTLPAGDLKHIAITFCFVCIRIISIRVKRYGFVRCKFHGADVKNMAFAFIVPGQRQQITGAGYFILFILQEILAFLRSLPRLHPALRCRLRLALYSGR